LESFSEKLLLEIVDLFSQVRDLRSLRLNDSQFTLMVTDLELKKSNVLKSFLILDLTSSKGGLKDLDLFVEKGELVVSSDQLGSKNISLIDNALEVFLELLNLLVSLLDDVGEFGNLIVKLISQLFGLFVFVLGVLQLTSDLFDFLQVNGFLVMLLGKGLIFGFDFVLKLRDLVRSNLELSLKLSNLILSLNEVLRVKVSIRSDSLIQVLLLLELSFELNVLFLELTDQVLLKLHLFNHLHKVCIGLRSLMRESISVLLKLIDLSEQLSDVLLLGPSLLLKLTNLIVLLGDLVLVKLILVIGLLDGL